MHWIGRAKRALLTGSAFLMGAIGGDRPVALRRLLAFESLEPRLPLSAAGLVPVGVQPDGGLSGKIVYIHPGHGYENQGGSWNFQRSEVAGTEMIEDLGTYDQMTFLADHLFRAGATLVPLRPVGHQTIEVVLDNDDPRVTFVGAWSNSVSTVFYGAAGDLPYRFASTSATETAYARYQPNIPQAGFYPVYAWTRSGSDRVPDQLYRVSHSGGITEITVNHLRVGNGLVYLGTYYFEAGNAGYVDISNRSSTLTPGSVVIADMIRFGNGIGNSGLPREDEASLYWIERHAAPPFAQGISAAEYGTSVVSASPRFAEFMNREANGALSDRVFVSYHSNAGGGRGALGLFNGNNDPATDTPNQFLLANTLASEVDNDMVAQNAQWNPDWFDRTTVTFDRSEFEFGEINNDWINDEFDATIIEVAFHDSIPDTELMREAKVRDAVARATYQGLVKYFRAVDGNTTPATELPPPVTNVRAVSNASGEVTLSWTPPVANAQSGGAATGYRIYASANGYGFDGGTFVAGGATNTATLTGYDPTIPYYFKVVAANAGGESHGSEVVTVLPSGGVKQVLIVNGFDRLDRALNPRQTLPAPDNTVDRVRPRESNSRDYVVQVHSAIHAAAPGVHVASTSNEAVVSGAVNLANYDTVIWILGEESTFDDTFNAAEQTKVEQFVAGGGNLFLSGAEIAWDLDAQGGGVSFFENTLKGNYVSDDANTYNVAVAAGGIFAGLPNFSFDNGALFYNSESPDVINPQSGAQATLTYSGGSGGNAAIQVLGTGGRGSIVMFGFPFETINSATRRSEVMDRVFDFFGLAAPAPHIDIETRVNGQDADSPTGPILAAGNTATFTYLVTNPGNLALSNVVVVDDNGTPGNPGDDFNPTFTGGDTNGNSLLDLTETWTYTAMRTVTAGQYTNVGSVTGDGNSQVAADSDSANHFGADPGVDIETLVNGQDADAPDGPTLAVGSTAAFMYNIVNTGNVSLINVLVDDDQGIELTRQNDPLGDNDNTLEVGETWQYTGSTIVTPGLYTNVGFVTAYDIIAQFVLDSDPANHFGAEPEADFNDDGFVDTADYVVWRKYDGTSVPAGTQGDANYDGQVNNADYLLWRAQFGTSVAAATSGASAAQARGGASSAIIETAATAHPASAVADTSTNDIALDTQVTTMADAPVGGTDLRTIDRPAVHRRQRVIAHADGNNWEVLLNALAERRVLRSTAMDDNIETAAEKDDLRDAAASDSAFSDRSLTPHRLLPFASRVLRTR